MSPLISTPAARPEHALFPGKQNVRPDRAAELAATAFVRKLCIRSHLKGYSYLITAIVLGKRHPHLLSSLTRLLYPAIAAIYRTTPAAVERNIRTAIELAAAHDSEHMQSVFYYRTKKPYISEVLALALDTIRLEEYAETDCSAAFLQ